MLSVTTLTGYMYCPRKIFLEKVLGLKEPPKPKTLTGTIRHETHDLINKAEEEFITNITEFMRLDELKESYLKHYREILKNVINAHKEELEALSLNLHDVFKKAWMVIVMESETRSNNVFHFMTTRKVYGKELWERLIPKIQSELFIESKGLQLRGVVDQIEVYGDQLVPIELKTGIAPKTGIWKEHKIQIGAYTLLLEEQFKKEIKEAFVIYLDSNERRHIPINPFLRYEVKKLINKVIFMLHKKKLPGYCDSINKCKVCGIREQCSNEKELKKQLQKINNP
jgi:CRISPR-associated protein Cas4